MKGDGVMDRWMAVLSAIALTGCASTTSSSLVRGMTAPNPSGCYIQVFAGERLHGIADFINGPMRYSTLSNLPNGADWTGRIRSIEVGPAATATIWTGANRSGKSMDLHLDRPYLTLPADFSGKVRSMDLRCEQSRIVRDPEPSSLAETK
jgi:hypothetical protein